MPKFMDIDTLISLSAICKTIYKNHDYVYKNKVISTEYMVIGLVMLHENGQPLILQLKVYQYNLYFGIICSSANI